MKFDIDNFNIDNVLDVLGPDRARRMKQVIDDQLEEGIQEMAEKSHDLAPVETTALKQSILASVTKLSRHHYMYGSHLPYAQRQEYEHKSKRFYFRRSVLSISPKIHGDLSSTVRRYFRR